LALLRARDPIPWESLDGDPVHTVLLLAAAVDRDEHLRIFARLARRLMDPSFRASVQACATAEALIKLFKSAVLEPA
jgi:mannitol/fructose-specific phosphotransferase system IIA component (Ntr-type)